jgi:hypothetical protein
LAHPRLVEIDAADDGFADLRGDRKVLEHFVRNEALIDAAQSVGKSFQYAFQSGDDFRKLVQ